MSRDGRGHRPGRRLSAPVVIALAALLTLPGAPARAGATGQVRGEVVAADTGRPVAGATVTLPDLGLSTTTRRNGRFAFDRPVPTEVPYGRVQALVTAAGFGSWTIVGAPLYPGEALLLNAELQGAAVTHEVLSPAERAARGPTDASAGPAGPPDGVTSSTCTAWDYQLVPPPTIKVYLHATGISKQYDFVFYVTHVLPNEWISSWDADALGAGAVAARTYAAYRAMTGHAVSSGTNCADIRDDTYDQVFDPTFTTASASAAVYATFGSILYREGGLFLSQYFAGVDHKECQAITTGEWAGRMSQWGTQTCATQGKLWPAIVQIFYLSTTWTYQGNLLLNPSVDSAATYPWVAVANTSYTRTQGGAYQGNYYLAVKPTGTGNAIVREERPFTGSVTTTYHAQAALRCPKTNATACSVEMRVVSTGAGHTVTAIDQITEPNDGVWRVYTFDPGASGVVHAAAWLSFVSLKPFDLDAAVLTSSFGGP